ncbi:MAG TPA: hypothetical protein GX717_03755, partial [Clostridiaceae bacterium]|nr:hypothetical protein [Clostridiaceae bacterium]
KAMDEVIPPSETGVKMSIFKQLKLSFKNRPFVIVCILFLIQGFAHYGVNAINVYWFKYVLGDQNPLATFTLITLIPSMLGAFTSQFWAGKFRDKGKTIGFTYLIQLVLFTLQFIIFRNSVNLVLLYGLGIIVQYAMGANMALIYGMVPDTIEYSEYITKGERMDGFLNTISSFWNKIGITIGTAGTSFVLGLTGYAPNVAEQAPSVILALDIMKWIMPAAFALIALILLRWYNLDHDTFDKLVAKLNEERPKWEAERALKKQQEGN